MPSEIDRLATVIGSAPLAEAVYESVRVALKHRSVHIGEGKTVWSVFERSLNTAIRDIESHPRGQLLLRLLEYGTADPDDPELVDGDGETMLTDRECGVRIDFIYCHMVNRFKGELAELLALEPVMGLMKQLTQEGLQPQGAQLNWGDEIRERKGGAAGLGKPAWGAFAKGADGLIVCQTVDRLAGSATLSVHGIVEVKSMARSVREVLVQIDRHEERLAGGVRLGSEEWAPAQVRLARSDKGDGLMKVIVLPSQWKLSRETRHLTRDDGTRVFRFTKPTDPPYADRLDEVDENVWKITLAWSQEALSQAAYEMTIWYMGQIGERLFSNRPIPESWQPMTKAEAGQNRAKHRLYIMGLRYLSKRQAQRWARIYNTYSFDFAHAADVKGETELWTDDIPVLAETEPGTTD